MNKTKKTISAIAAAVAVEMVFCALLSANALGDLKAQPARFLNTGVQSKTAQTVSADEAAEADAAPVLLTGKESSYEAPLKLGETGICELYEPSLETNQKIAVQVTQVIRGDQAKAILEEYQKENNAVSVDELPNNALEYAAVDYKVCAVDQSVGEISPLLKLNIKNAKGEPLEYDNVIYTKLSSIDISGFKEIKPGTVVSVRGIFAIPVECNNYALEFGADNGQKAVFHITAENS